MGYLYIDGYNGQYCVIFIIDVSHGFIFLWARRSAFWDCMFVCWFVCELLLCHMFVSFVCVWCFNDSFNRDINFL